MHSKWLYMVSKCAAAQQARAENSCRSQKTLQNKPSLAKLCFDILIQPRTSRLKLHTSIVVVFS